MFLFSPKFLEIKHATLIQLLNQRIFKTDAKTLFDKVFDWAKKNACIQKDDSKGTIYREVLGEALSLIPFNEMSQIQIFEVYDTGILTSTEILFYLRPIVTANDKPVILLPPKTDFVEQNNSESTQKVANKITDKSIELLNRVTTSSEMKNERDTYLHGSLKNEHKPLEKTDKLETLKPHVARWHAHIASFSDQELEKWNGGAQTSASTKGNDKPAAGGDEDFDLFDSKEEDDEEKIELTEKRLADYVAKKPKKPGLFDLPNQT